MRPVQLDTKRISVSDKARLFLSTPEEFQVWYSRIDPQWLAYHGETHAFKRLVYRHYGWKVQILRFWFRIKDIISGRALIRMR